MRATDGVWVSGFFSGHWRLKEFNSDTLFAVCFPAVCCFLFLFFCHLGPHKVRQPLVCGVRRCLLPIRKQHTWGLVSTGSIFKERDPCPSDELSREREAGEKLDLEKFGVVVEIRYPTYVYTFSLLTSR